MSKKFSKGSLKGGFASLLIIFVLGMVGILIGVSLIRTGRIESLMARASANSNKAYYASNSGLEEALYRLSKDSAYTCDGTSSACKFVINGSDVSVKVVGSTNSRIVTAVGKNGIYTRKIVAVLSNLVGIEDAIFADSGGITLENNTLVTMLSGFTGGADQPKIWSNSFIRGRNKRTTGGASSQCGGR